MRQLGMKVISAFCIALILFISPGSSLAANANTQNHQQQGSSKAAIVGGVIGGTAGGMASIAAISATGSVAGLSAAGMTSGLAAVGSLIGGGMLGGLAVTAALPLVGVAGVGWAAYKIFQHPVDSQSSPTQIINNVINLSPIPAEKSSSMLYIVLAVALLFCFLSMVVFFRNYSKGMNQKLNDLTTLMVDRELDT